MLVRPIHYIVHWNFQLKCCSSEGIDPSRYAIPQTSMPYYKYTIYNNSKLIHEFVCGLWWMKGWEESLWGAVSEVNASWCDDAGPFFHLLLTQDYHWICFTLGNLNRCLAFWHIVAYAYTFPSPALLVCTKPKQCLKQYHLKAPIK